MYPTYPAADEKFRSLIDQFQTSNFHIGTAEMDGSAAIGSEGERARRICRAN